MRGSRERDGARADDQGAGAEGYGRAADGGTGRVAGECRVAEDDLCWEDGHCDGSGGRIREGGREKD